MENNKILAVTSGVILVVIIGLILRLAKPVFFPFFLAIFFNFILSPVLDFLMRLKIPKPIAIFFIIVVAFCVLYLLGILIYTSGKEFAASIPQYGKQINSLFHSLLEKIGLAKVSWDPWAWSKSLDVNKVTALVVSSLDRIFSFFSTFSLIFVFLIFMLAGRSKLTAKVEKSFHSERAKKINQIIENIDSQIQKYLIIKTGISLISGVFTASVLVIFGVRYAIIFGFLTFLLNYVPSVGSIIAIAFSCLAAAFQLGSFWPALWVLLILIILDVFLANFIEPKLMGQGLGLSPLVVLFSLIFWGWLWGIPGMILAVPLLAVIKIICSNIPSLQFIAEIMSS
jgi:predicted PurR-regulated permease PerM